MCKKSEKIQIIRIFHIISYFDFSEFFETFYNFFFAFFEFFQNSVAHQARCATENIFVATILWRTQPTKIRGSEDCELVTLGSLDPRRRCGDSWEPPIRLWMHVPSLVV